MWLHITVLLLGLLLSFDKASAQADRGLMTRRLMKKKQSGKPKQSSSNKDPKPTTPATTAKPTTTTWPTTTTKPTTDGPDPGTTEQFRYHYYSQYENLNFDTQQVTTNSTTADNWLCQVTSKFSLSLWDGVELIEKWNRAGQPQWWDAKYEGLNQKFSIVVWDTCKGVYLEYAEDRFNIALPHYTKSWEVTARHRIFTDPRLDFKLNFDEEFVMHTSNPCCDQVPYNGIVKDWTPIGMEANLDTAWMFLQSLPKCKDCSDEQCCMDIYGGMIPSKSQGRVILTARIAPAAEGVPLDEHLDQDFPGKGKAKRVYDFEGTGYRAHGRIDFTFYLYNGEKYGPYSFPNAMGSMMQVDREEEINTLDCDDDEADCINYPSQWWWE